MPKITIEAYVDDKAIEHAAVIIKEEGQLVKDASLSAAFIAIAVHGFYRSLDAEKLPFPKFLENLKEGIEDLASVYKAPESEVGPGVEAFSIPVDAEKILSGDMVVCPSCGEKHAAEGAEAGSADGGNLPILVVRCPEDDSTHLVAIMGMAVSKVE